jgi:hypothetical protein
MGIFVDLAGASGASYRFRAWPEAGQSPAAGNFAVVEVADGALKVHLVGVTNNLSTCERPASAAGFENKRLFVRLNVARLTRRREYEDLVAHYAPEHVVEVD